MDKYDRKMQTVIQKIKDRIFKKGQQYKEIVSHLKTKTGPEGPPGRPGTPGEDGAPGKVILFHAAQGGGVELISLPPAWKSWTSGPPWTEGHPGESRRRQWRSRELDLS